MNQILAMTKPHATCAIPCATAVGFSKVNSFSDFAEPFGSAFFLPSVILSEARRAESKDPDQQFNIEFNN